jgi:hypothetical protein
VTNGTTRRLDDNAPVEFSSAIEAWAAAGRPVLEQVAKSYGSYVTYQELAEEVQNTTGIRTQVPFRHWIGKVLYAVATSPRAPNEPMLTSLVVRADGTIGPGYAGPLAERDGETPADLDVQAAEERLDCYRYFGALLPADGGRPMLTRQVAERRRIGVRNRTKPLPSPAICPTCHLALPRTGRCDNCD